MTVREWLMMAAFWAAFIGLLVGWRWEGVGGAITLVSLCAFYLINYAASGRFPKGWVFAVMALPAILFLVCWLEVAASQKRPSTRS